MQTRLCNISREVETLRNKQKEMTGIKQAVAEIKIAFDRLRYMKHSQEKGITESENKSMKLLKLKCKEKKIWGKKKKNVQRLWDNVKDVMYLLREKKEQDRSI